MHTRKGVHFLMHNYVFYLLRYILKFDYSMVYFNKSYVR